MLLHAAGVVTDPKEAHGMRKVQYPRPSRPLGTVTHPKLKREYERVHLIVLCEGCGFQPALDAMRWSVLHIHHIRRAVDGGDDSWENLLILCANCHSTAHWLFPQRIGEYSSTPTRSKLLKALSDPAGWLKNVQAEMVETLRPTSDNRS